MIIKTISFWAWILSIVLFTSILGFLIKINGTFVDRGDLFNIFILDILLGVIFFLIYVITLIRSRNLLQAKINNKSLAKPDKFFINTLLITCFITVLTISGISILESLDRIHMIDAPNIQPLKTVTPVNPTIIITIAPTAKPRPLDGGRLFNLVNEYRSKNGLNQLLWYLPLCDFAKARSQQVKDDWSHDGYQKEATEGDLYKSICPECDRTGENLAKDFPNENAAIQGWIKSPSHKANLDGNWDWACAMYYSNNYVSIIFGAKK